MGSRSFRGRFWILYGITHRAGCMVEEGVIRTINQTDAML